MPLALALLAAAAPATLAPSGPWNVETTEDMCLLSRPFGTGKSRVVIGFQPLFNSERMDVIAVEAVTDSTQRTGRATLSVGDRTFAGDYFTVSTRGGGQRLTRITTDAALFDALAPDAVLRVRARPLAAAVTLPRFDKALAVFRQCQAGLLRGWGVDPASVRPENAPRPIAAWRAFMSSDYPLGALAQGTYGRVVTVLNVDAAGAVTKCRVVASAGKDLNDATCRRALTIRFEPGRDDAGRPAPSVAVLPVKWEIPHR